jgi:hypothetical protein
MTATPAQRNRRALIVFGAAVVLYLVTSQFIFPWYDQLRAATGLAAEKEEQLRRYRQELLHQGNYRVLTADVRKKILEAVPYFFGNPAELQKLVEDGAKAVGIDLAQRSAVQTKRIDDVVYEIAMTITFQCTPGQLVRFLDQLRQSPKIANVRAAQIDPAQVAFEPPKTGEFRKMLRVNLTIAGQGLAAAALDKVD